MPLQGGDSKQGDLRIKRFMTMIDSMTEKELNSSDLKMLSQRSRVERISRGAGRRPEEFLELLGGLTLATVRSAQAGPELTLLGRMQKGRHLLCLIGRQAGLLAAPCHRCCSASAPAVALLPPGPCSAPCRCMPPAALLLCEAPACFVLAVSPSTPAGHPAAVQDLAAAALLQHSPQLLLSLPQLLSCPCISYASAFTQAMAALSQ